MDEALKVIISGTLHTLARIPKDERTWGTIMEAVRQNGLFEAAPEDEMTRVKSLIREGHHTFKFDGSPEPATVREVEAWFDELISDHEIRQATEIDINVVAKIVAQTGAAVTGILNLFTKGEYHEQTIVDIGVLRFPDPSHPFIKLYRIQLKAWSHCNRVLATQLDRNGITGDFHSHILRPHKELINKLAPETLRKAVEEAEAFFNDGIPCP